jgi:ABC-2 type transport system permease protein/sodium transport system permease protein
MTPAGGGPTPGQAAGLSSQLGRLGRLVRKELNEILRDRRTIITLVLMPLLLYPLLSIAFRHLLLASHKGEERPVYQLGFRSEREGTLVANYLGWKFADGGTHPTRSDPRHKNAGPEPEIRLLVPQTEKEGKAPNLEKLLRESAIDLGVRVRNLDQTEPDVDGNITLDLLYQENSARGREVLGWVERQCDLANAQLLRLRLRRLGVRQRVEPIKTVRVARPNPDDKGGSFLVSLVPLILILMTITGAVYPAIDLTAGERERGTLEILVAAPVPRLGLLFAKYVTVLTVAVLTALVNLVMMTVTLLVNGMLGGAGLSAVSVLQVFALLLLFAAFFSAVLLALTSFARSFKEAQAYLIPLMLVSLAPGLLAMKSDLELSGFLSVVPLLNIVLLARDLFHATADASAAAVDPFLAAVVVLSTLLYALAALAAAARIFGAEAVLYSEQRSWSDLFRRPAEPQPVASVNGALSCLAVIFPAFFVATGLIGRWGSATPALYLGLLALASAGLFVGLPLAAAALGRVRLASGFQLRRAAWPAYAAALLLGLSLWPFALELLAALQRWGWGTLAPEHFKALQALQRRLDELSPVTLLLGYAVVPAVAEELFFRGYLFSALRARTGPATTIGASALLFGLFHILFAVDRVVPATLLGLVLGWVCWKSGSVFPGMVIHVCHNAVTGLISHYRAEIRRLGWFEGSGGEHLPLPWLLAAAVGAVLAALLIQLTREGEAPAEPCGSARQEPRPPEPGIW